MLHIEFKTKDFDENRTDIMHVAPKWFDGNFEDEWLQDPFVIEIVKEVDHSDLVDKILMSPVLGTVDALKMSGGSKTLICLYKEPSLYKYNVKHCGDNCCNMLLEIGKRKDIHIFVPQLLDLTGEFSIYLENSNKVITNEIDYRRELYFYRRGRF